MKHKLFRGDNALLNPPPHWETVSQSPTMHTCHSESFAKAQDKLRERISHSLPPTKSRSFGYRLRMTLGQSLCLGGKRWGSLLILTLLLGAPSLHAHEERPAAVSSGRQPEVLKAVHLSPQLGTRWPSDVVLRDEAGAAASLGDFISGKPAIVLLSYFSCSMLCPVLFEGVARSLKAVSLNLGSDFAVVVISIDPRDGAPEARNRKQELIKRYPGSAAGSGWHFLTGDKAAIERVTEAAGFGYSYDAATQQYAHPAALFVLNVETKLARVLYGVEPAPRDLRLALVEASSGRIGTAADKLLLYCYHYDPLTGKYGSIIMGVMRLSGLATLLTLAGWISFMLLSDRRAAQEKPVNVEP